MTRIQQIASGTRVARADGVCELFAMSARFPTTVRHSLEELARHGGGTGPHRDGWGIGLWHDGDALLVREPDAAHGSRWVEFLQQNEPRTTIAIAHVRKATQGGRLLRNTQPFAREVGGRTHLFAHNGMLPRIEQDERFPCGRFRRIGETDSEHAFLALLARIEPLWSVALPPLEERLRVVQDFARDLRTLGPANFLYTDGDAIFAHGHRRRQDDGEIRPPGLHVLCRTCSGQADGPQRVALLASVPLTREGWEPLAEGEVIVLADGKVVRRVAPDGESFLQRQALMA